MKMLIDANVKSIQLFLTMIVETKKKHHRKRQEAQWLVIENE